MTRHQKATKSVCMNLTTEQIAALNSICNSTLAAQPDLRHWICPVEIATGVELPFLPIRAFRLKNVSRFNSAEECRAATGAAHAFFSSGSTQSVRARHLLSTDGIQAYRKSVCAGLASVQKRFDIPQHTPILSLVPSFEIWNDSSLAAMMSLWSEGGYPVHFVDLQHDPAALHKKLAEMATNFGSHNGSLIIFGTSLHHLQVNQWNELNNAGQPFIHIQRAWCFDTGGTKGRTQNTTHAALSHKINSWFTQECHVTVLSEYGMCELTSQAYSAHAPHDGVFACSPGLRAVALSHDLNAVLPVGEPGFLSFIDFANIDSWPCIISEDLGMCTSTSGQEFELLGRAPDATLKGCSLNVRDNFQFTLRAITSSSTAADIAPAAADIAPAATEMTDSRSASVLPHKILAGLSKELWPNTSLTDLKLSLQSAHNDHLTHQLIERSELRTKNIAIVASANIPISWLFPALHAWLMGAGSVHLFLPGVRAEAALSELIRKQITDLAHAINRACRVGFIQVHHHRLLETAQQQEFDNVVVFGSDETVAAIRANLAIKKQKVHFTGLGHFQNGLSAEGMSPRTIAEHCSLWMGRGCLTPLVVSLSSSASAAEAADFARQIFEAMCEIKKQRMLEYPDPSVFQFEKYAHQHNLFEIKTLLNGDGLTAKIHQDANSGVVVLDLSGHAQVEDDLLKRCLESAGCGWLNVVRESPSLQLPNENPSPGLFDTHQGRTWYEWLTKAEKICV